MRKFCLAVVMVACAVPVAAMAQDPFTVDVPILGCHTQHAVMASVPNDYVMPTHAIMPGCRMIPAATRLTVVKLDSVGLLALLAIGGSSNGELWTMVSWIQKLAPG